MSAKLIAVISFTLAPLEMNIDNKNGRIMIKFGLNVEQNVDQGIYINFGTL